LIHLIPLFVYLVDYFPFFIRTASEKAIIYQHLSFVQLNTEFNEGFFMPAGWHVIIRYILMVGYWLAQLVMILKVIRLDGSQFQKDNRTRMNWLIWILVSEALIIFPPLSTFFIGMHSLTAVLIQISGLMAACIQVYFLFSHPEILYGIKGVIIEPVNLHIKPEELDDADQSTASLNILIPKSTIQYIPEQTLDSIENILGQYMEEKKPFLKKGFGLSDMANDTQFTLHQLSGYINIRCGMNFYNYVNQFRIDHCKKLLLANAHQNKTLEAIANESGFQSRATFIRSFKKFTGHTPSEYIKELKPIENVA
jgi:AraC-like DNA-binding protein